MMPDTNERRDSEFAKYDAMSTEELQQILREDASKPVGEESDSQALFYIMEVLAKRRKEQTGGKDPAEALASFKNNYYTETETSSDSESVAVTRKQFNGGRWRRGLVAAVVAICILVIGNSITASAFGFDLWEIIAKWTQETFHLGYAGQANDPNGPDKGVVLPYSKLQIALDELNIHTPLAPTWIPDGYSESDVRVTETPMQRLFMATYEHGSSIVFVRIAGYLGNSPTQIEQSDTLIEVYPVGDIDYYIFQNEGQLQAVWINENFECYISGPLTLSEIKQMIDSIEKG